MQTAINIHVCKYNKSDGVETVSVSKQSIRNQQNLVGISKITTGFEVNQQKIRS